MPAAYTIDAARRLVLSRGWGILSAGDLQTHVRTLTADPRFDPACRQLMDFREVTDLDFDSATVREMAKLSPFGAGARRAILVGSDVAYGMTRMFQILREPTEEELEVFRQLQPALEWLGLAHDETSVISALRNAPPLPSSD